MNSTFIIAGTVLAVTLILSAAGLWAWRGWLNLRRLELVSREPREMAPKEDVGMRIELAAVRERLKKLEAIASGVEL
jgi:hypothetical protein